MKTIIIIVSIVCAAAIGVAVWFAVKPVPAKPRTVALSEAWNTHVNTEYWQEGPEDAKVIIDEYSDLQCPYCRQFSATLQAALPLVTETTVAVRFHHFPLSSIHNKAMQAAIATEAAGRQGKFWEMHNLLYQRQSAWEQETTFSFATILRQYAKEISLDEEQFKADIADSTTNDIVMKNISEGTKLGVSATPTIYINGVKQESPPFDPNALVALINAAGGVSQ